MRGVGAAASSAVPTLSPQLLFVPCSELHGECKVPGFAQAFGITHPSKCPAPLYPQTFWLMSDVDVSSCFLHLIISLVGERSF